MTPDARARQQAGWAKLQEIMEDEELEVLDVDVWYQTSRRYRSVARVPEGMTAKEALLDAQLHYKRQEALKYGWKEPSDAEIEALTKQVNGMDEESATDRSFDFTSRYPERYPNCAKELNHKSFMAFRKVGGDTTKGRFYERAKEAKRSHGTPVILMRASLAEDDELQVAQRHFNVALTRAAVPPNSLVIGRYSVLPYYAELEEDLAVNGSKLINSHAQHKFVADLKEWYPLLEGHTPKTYFSLSEFKASVAEASDRSYVLKGQTNSKKQQWNTHMFAATASDVDAVYARLADDSYIGNQDIYIREYVPLRSFGEGIRGLPITEEYRFFILDGKILARGNYWSQFPEVVKEHGLCAGQVPEKWLRTVIDKVQDRIRFFVMDVARTAEGSWIVIELNDGCMSGLSDVNPENLYTRLKQRLT